MGHSSSVSIIHNQSNKPYLDPSQVAILKAVLEEKVLQEQILAFLDTRNYSMIHTMRQEEKRKTLLVVLNHQLGKGWSKKIICIKMTVSTTKVIHIQLEVLILTVVFYKTFILLEGRLQINYWKLTFGGQKMIYKSKLPSTSTLSTKMNET